VQDQRGKNRHGHEKPACGMEEVARCLGVLAARLHLCELPAHRSAEAEIKGHEARLHQRQDAEQPVAFRAERAEVVPDRCELDDRRQP
jgi:hypothetical protein